MYYIDSKVDKPDIKYLENKLKECMKDGIRLSNIEDLHLDLKKRKENLVRDIRENYGIDNPNSSKQIIEFLDSMNNLEVYEVCYENDKWTSNKEAMITLSGLGYKFADDILHYRKIKKYEESVSSLKSSLKEDGMVHPEVHIAKTNRINYRNPALMNIPKEIMGNVLAPRKQNNILISVDIKNQEPFILANILQDEFLKEAIKSPKGFYEELFYKVFETKAVINLWVNDTKENKIIDNKDLVISEKIPKELYANIVPSIETYFNNKKVRSILPLNFMFNRKEEFKLPDQVQIELENGEYEFVKVNWEKCKDKDLKKNGIVKLKGSIEGLEVECKGIIRREFKTVWNALTYGLTKYGIDRICKHIDGNLVYEYFNSIKSLKDYKSMCYREARHGVQEAVTYFGTILIADEEKSRLQRVLMDLPIQGTGSDILALLVKHFDSEVQRLNIEDKLNIYFTRHDEIVLEVSSDWINSVGMDNVLSTIRDILEHKIDDWEPFKLEIMEIKSNDLDFSSENLYIDE